MSKRKPQNLSVWFDDGARSAHEGEAPPTLEEAIEKYKPPAEAIDAFTRGYLRGRIMNAINNFQWWMKYMDNDQLQRLGDSLQALREQYDSELSREDATYKVKGLFDQYD